MDWDCAHCPSRLDSAGTFRRGHEMTWRKPKLSWNGFLISTPTMTISSSPSMRTTWRRSRGLAGRQGVRSSSRRCSDGAPKTHSYSPSSWPNGPPGTEQAPRDRSIQEHTQNSSMSSEQARTTNRGITIRDGPSTATTTRGQNHESESSNLEEPTQLSYSSLGRLCWRPHGRRHGTLPEPGPMVRI